MDDIDLEVHDSEFVSSTPVKLKSTCVSEAKATTAIKFLEMKLAALNQSITYEWHCNLLKTSNNKYRGRMLVVFGHYLVVAVHKGKPVDDCYNWNFMSLDGKTRFSRKDILRAFEAIVDDGYDIVIGPIASKTYVNVSSIESLLIQSDLEKGIA